MSGFLTRTPGIDWIYTPDYSLYESDVVASDDRPDHLHQCMRKTEFDTYFNIWPTGGILGGFSPMTQSGILPAAPYNPFLQSSNWTGHLGWKTFSGITRDTNSAILGSTVVALFRTSDDLRMDERTSDPSTGAYAVYSSDTGNHYLVAYKAGSPDVSGTTANNLTGV